MVLQRFDLKESLFWRISFSFLIILILLGLSYVFITTFAARRYYQEVTQRVNAHVAESMLQEVSPFVDGKVNKEALGKIMHSMMAVNPNLEVYLLDPKGKILSYVVLDKKVKLNRVSIVPIHEFLSGEGKKYVLGDDPRNPGSSTIFSATEVYEDDRFRGYVYMVLASEKYENITSALLTSYWLKVGTRTFIVTLIAAFAIGLFLIWLLTRNLRGIIKTVKEFEKGNLQARIPEKNTKGELARLSHTFNNMADTILNNIEEMKKVDQLRRELIANVSHDLRNPLAVIHGYIETLMIKDKNLTFQDRQKYLQIILDSSEKLQKLVTNLFELSKLETDQITVNKEPFMINELVNDAAQNIRFLAEQKNIEIRSNIETSLPMVYADIALIERVIQNLLDNAIKYTPDKGQIDLNVEQNDGHVKVDIANTGKGIPEKDLPLIFDRYYMIDKEKKGIDGSGLGLAIVKRILEIHESAINVTSQPDIVTSFSFELPTYK